MEDRNDNIVVRYDLPKNWSEEKYFSLGNSATPSHQSLISATVSNKSSKSPTQLDKSKIFPTASEESTRKYYMH